MLKKLRISRATVATVVATLVLLGCAGQRIKMSPEDQRGLASQPNIYAVHHQPGVSFLVESTGYTVVAVLLSPMVAGAMVAEGMGIQRDLKLPDLAPRVKERLVNSLKADSNLTNVRMVSEVPQSTNIETLKKTFDTGVVLDVQTRKWGIDNNRAKYSALVRLVRLSDSTVLWEAACNEFVADKGRSAPAREALVANDGELLKAKLREAADGCADELSAWMAGKGS
jgi:hypothetical protein